MDFVLNKIYGLPNVIDAEKIVRGRLAQLQVQGYDYGYGVSGKSTLSIAYENPSNAVRLVANFEEKGIVTVTIHSSDIQTAYDVQESVENALILDKRGAYGFTQYGV